MEISYKHIHADILSFADGKRAINASRFFKTGKGEYGEGDIFIGLTVPMVRKFVKKYHDIRIACIKKLLQSPIHEERLLALLILVERYQGSEKKEQNNIAEFYIQNINYINNWDLVDLSAHKILGAYVCKNKKTLLTQLARSKNMWKRRIAIIATAYFIKHDVYKETFRIAKLLLYDDRDLIHKAVGWMLREVGKRDMKKEEEFLKKYYMTMPRTMLRYAIERFPEIKRKRYLSGSI